MYILLDFLFCFFQIKEERDKREVNDFINKQMKQTSDIMMIEHSATCIFL